MLGPQSEHDVAGGMKAGYKAQHAGVPFRALLAMRQTGALQMQAAACHQLLQRDAAASHKHVGGDHEMK